MNLRWTALCVAAACLSPVVAMGQTYVGEHAHHSPSVIRPVDSLWADYDGGCGCHGGLRGKCCGPIGCPYGVGASCGCGGCNDGCNYRIGCGVPYAFHRLTRSLDCLLPCRPKLLGCGSGWGGCSPCYDPSCGGGCPKPCFAKRMGFFGGCAKCDRSVACNLDCSCGMPAPLMGAPPRMPTAPLPPPDSQVNPFQDDNAPPEPMPTDARRNPRAKSHFSNGPTPARRPVNRSASISEPGRPHVTPRPISPSQRVLPAGHASADTQDVRQASAEIDDVINDYTRARAGVIQSFERTASAEEYPVNPLR
jgi:hypothetical protein